MPFENLTGITIPHPFSVSDETACRSVLQGIASSCASHLRQGGYFSDDEAGAMLRAYQDFLYATTFRPEQAVDFLLFCADLQAQQHSVTVEGEVHRMQSLLLLRWSSTERIYSWTFNTLSGRVTSLYEHSPELRSVCAMLNCPAMLAGEPSIVHVASINPVAVHVTMELIKEELVKANGDIPFVYPLMINMTLWNTLRQRHFPAA